MNAETGICMEHLDAIVRLRAKHAAEIAEMNARLSERTEAFLRREAALMRLLRGQCRKERWLLPSERWALPGSKRRFRSPDAAIVAGLRR